MRDKTQKGKAELQLKETVWHCAIQKSKNKLASTKMPDMRKELLAMSSMNIKAPL